MIIKEWFCAEHGEFEASHAICPAVGCESAEVVREIRTAPGVRSDSTKRTDAGLRKSAESFGFSNIKSAREGESSKPNNQAAQVLWGNEAEKMLGKPLTTAHAPATFKIKGEDGRPATWTDRGGMATAATDIGLTDQVQPRGTQRTYHKTDKEARSTIATK